MQIRSYRIRSLLTNLDYEWRVADKLDIGKTSGNILKRCREVCEKLVEEGIYVRRNKHNKIEYRYNKFMILTFILFTDVDLIKKKFKEPKEILDPYLEFFNTVDFKLMMRSAKVELLNKIKNIARKLDEEYYMNLIRRYIIINFDRYVNNFSDWQGDNPNSTDIMERLCAIFDAKIVDINKDLLAGLSSEKKEKQRVICENLVEGHNRKNISLMKYRNTHVFKS